MKKFLIILFSFIVASCVEEEQFQDTPQGNFDACWKILNEKYCFFSFKDIDWNDIYYKYKPQVSSNIKKDSLFNILNNMLKELKDGHVNIYSPFNVGRYWDWFENYPENFNEDIQKNYIGTNYKIASGMKYIMLPDSIGYIYYSSFSSSISNLGLDYILAYFANTKGIIFDVRNNTGGALTNVEAIASRFTNNKYLSGYISHKTGSGHNDFSELYPFYVNPSERIHYNKPVAVLTNRHTFSAANNFVGVIKILPQVTTIGDITGGGSGLPFSSELPNGWSIRFSASPIYDNEKKQTEFGISPDIKVDMTKKDMENGIDTIIETAIDFILSR
ncbi:MAG: S41 family peptidase [Bacteroidales bacterium]|nr:S41 family peptidase [Bacteroidales bacterium]